MEVYHHKHSFLIILTEDEIEELPDTYIEELNNHCVNQDKENKYSVFGYTDFNIGEQFYERIKKYYKFKKKRKSRDNSEYFYSSGVLEKEDIESIKEIQENKCYFTGADLKKGNFSIDHMTPISQDGSFWPGNIAIVLKEVNLDKHDRSATQYWNILKKRHGNEWVKTRKIITKSIDYQRKKLDRKRKKIINTELFNISESLSNEYLNDDISLELYDGSILLSINSIEVNFPKGFIRKKSKYNNIIYYRTIINSILS